MDELNGVNSIKPNLLNKVRQYCPSGELAIVISSRAQTQSSYFICSEESLTRVCDLKLSGFTNAPGISRGTHTHIDTHTSGREGQIA
jgi:hypothetical protein